MPDPTPQPTPRPKKPVTNPTRGGYSAGHKGGAKLSGEEESYAQDFIDIVGGFITGAVTAGDIHPGIVESRSPSWQAGFAWGQWKPATHPYPGLMYGPDGDTEPNRPRR